MASILRRKSRTVALHMRTTDSHMHARFAPEAVNETSRDHKGCAGGARHMAHCALQLARQFGDDAQILEASDNELMDAQIREAIPLVVQSRGLPVHTGRPATAGHSHGYTKAMVDFFVFTRASVMVSNCFRGSTYAINAKLLRGHRPSIGPFSAGCKQLGNGSAGDLSRPHAESTS